MKKIFLIFLLTFSITLIFAISGRSGVEASAEQPPMCESLTINGIAVTSEKNKIIYVKSPESPVKITASGVYFDQRTKARKTPSRIDVFMAAGSQMNKSSTDNYCTFHTGILSRFDPHYSYYCGGQQTWKMLSYVQNTSLFSIEVPFKQLVKYVDENAKFYNIHPNGDLNKVGIQLAVNITGDQPNDICSGNIARYGGNGAYYNNGKWNTPCRNSCNVLIRLENTK